MKTCPACHQAVLDDAAKCPHPACEHFFGAPRKEIKRPPPPPTRVNLARKDAHSAAPRAIVARPAILPKRSRWQLFVWLFAILVGAGVVAAGLAAYLPLSGENRVASVDVAGKPSPTAKTADEADAPSSTQVPNQEAPAKSHDDKTTPVQKPATELRKAESQKDGKADSTEPAPPESQGIVADQQKNMVDDKPVSLVRNASPEPTPLGVPEQPKLDIADEKPKGLYAARTKPKTAEWLAEYGGTVESQQAVDDGLNWLARHQGKDGHWGADCLGTGPYSRCSREAPCHVTGWNFDVAHTGLALLAFQAAGHYHFNGQKYSSQVKSGLDYLLRKQSFEGSFSDSNTPNPQERSESPSGSNVSFMYEHAMATFAMCESCAVALADGKTPNPRYQRAAQRAVSYIENIQHDDGGWRYTVNASEQSDCSVSGWVMLALKTAREAKLNVAPKTISRMMEFFAAHYADGRTFYQFRGYSTSDAMTAVGMMAVVFFEHTLGSPVVQTGATYLADQADVFAVMTTHPVGARRAEALFDIISNDHGYYLLYNCTMAMFQVGGEPWKRWNEAIRDRAIALQVRGDGCDRGSWSPDHDPYGDLGGRIYSTALAVLTLEVYYRFQRVADQPEKEKFFEK